MNEKETAVAQMKLTPFSALRPILAVHGKRKRKSIFSFFFFFFSVFLATSRYGKQFYFKVNFRFCFRSQFFTKISRFFRRGFRNEKSHFHNSYAFTLLINV